MRKNILFDENHPEGLNLSKKKTYIVFADGRIGYIRSACHYSVCEVENKVDLFIDDLEGVYLDCINANDMSNIIYIGESLHEAISSIAVFYKNKIMIKDNINRYLQNVISLYDKEIIKSNKE